MLFSGGLCKIRSSSHSCDFDNMPGMLQKGGGHEMQVQASAPSVAMGPGCPLPIMLQPDDVDRLPSTSPIEKLYRYMWRRKV